MGLLLEKFIGLELLRAAHTGNQSMRIRFWRDPDGPEIDWLMDVNGAYTPIEVKWTDRPSASDVRHLEVFLSEYPSAKIGYLVCRVPRKVKLTDKIFALPWQSLNGLTER